MYVLKSVCAVHLYISPSRSTLILIFYFDRNIEKIDDCFALALTGLSQY